MRMLPSASSQIAALSRRQCRHTLLVAAIRTVTSVVLMGGLYFQIHRRIPRLIFGVARHTLAQRGKTRLTRRPDSPTDALP
jgi:hypothetical protein